MRAERRLLYFRRLALVGALLAAVVVVLGAWVRLTNAGLGCPDWPGCYGHAYPATNATNATMSFAKALHEMIHRYVASSLGLVVVGLAALAIWNRKVPGQPVAPVLVLLALICLQGALGALTVTLLLTPLIVTAHLLGGLTTLAILAWLSLTPERRGLAASERPLRAVALLGLGVLILQIALGGWTSTNYAAVACPDFPTCQASWWPHMDYRNAFVLWRGLGTDYEGGVLASPARVAIHVTHRLGALVAGSVLITVALVTLLRAQRSRLRIAAVLLLCAVCLQISIGIATVHWAVPLPLATLHNAGAAFLVLTTVILLRALWPVSSDGVITLPHVHRSR
jgi:cytochrome c oxidase assembly protein subunit 15